MTSYLRLIPLLAASLFTAASMAQSSIVPPAAVLPQLGEYPLKDVIDQVKAVKKIPVQGLSIVETADGKAYLVSDNGRFAVIGGRWIDIWEGKTITGIADSGSLDKINLPRMGINFEELSPYVVGNGPKQATVFVDPLCDDCKRLVREMKALESKYTFKVLLLPLKGGPSGIAARRMHCSPDKKMAMEAFLNGSFDSLPKDPPGCDVSPVQKTMITAMVLGIRGTPFVIRPDFTTAMPSVTPKSLESILESK